MTCIQITIKRQKVVWRHKHIAVRVARISKGEIIISCADSGIMGSTVTEQFDQTFFLCAGADWAEDRPTGRILASRLCR